MLDGLFQFGFFPGPTVYRFQSKYRSECAYHGSSLVSCFTSSPLFCSSWVPRSCARLNGADEPSVGTPGLKNGKSGGNGGAKGLKSKENSISSFFYALEMLYSIPSLWHNFWGSRRWRRKMPSRESLGML